MAKHLIGTYTAQIHMSPGTSVTYDTLRMTKEQASAGGTINLPSSLVGGVSYHYGNNSQLINFNGSTLTLDTSMKHLVIPTEYANPDVNVTGLNACYYRIIINYAGGINKYLFILPTETFTYNVYANTTDYDGQENWWLYGPFVSNTTYTIGTYEYGGDYKDIGLPACNNSGTFSMTTSISRGTLYQDAYTEPSTRPICSKYRNNASGYSSTNVAGGTHASFKIYYDNTLSYMSGLSLSYISGYYYTTDAPDTHTSVTPTVSGAEQRFNFEVNTGDIYHLVTQWHPVYRGYTFSNTITLDIIMSIESSHLTVRQDRLGWNKEPGQFEFATNKLHIWNPSVASAIGTEEFPVSIIPISDREVAYVFVTTTGPGYGGPYSSNVEAFYWNTNTIQIRVVYYLKISATDDWQRILRARNLIEAGKTGMLKEAGQWVSSDGGGKTRIGLPSTTGTITRTEMFVNSGMYRAEFKFVNTLSTFAHVSNASDSGWYVLVYQGASSNSATSGTYYYDDSGIAEFNPGPYLRD